MPDNTSNDKNDYRRKSDKMRLVFTAPVNPPNWEHKFDPDTEKKRNQWMQNICEDVTSTCD